MAGGRLMEIGRVNTLRLVAAGGEPTEVQLERRHGPSGEEEITASVAGETLTLSLLPGEGGGLMRIGSRLQRYFALRRGAGVQLWIGGDTYDFAVPEAGVGAAGAAGREPLPPGGIVEAPMPGRVLKMLVTAGEEVEAA